MKLPNRENAYVPLAKIKDYLLSETHSVGRSKAKFFRLAGFKEDNLKLLERGLIAIAYSEEVKEVSSSRHGARYVLDGPLRTPDGRTVQIRTVWAIDEDGNRPRFVTAYPL